MSASDGIDLLTVEYIFVKGKERSSNDKIRLYMCNRWSDFNFFAIFENGHIAIDYCSYIGMSSIPKKSANFAACARGNDIIFKTSQGP